jgi:DNA-binding GntR family transcriptional regulator
MVMRFLTKTDWVAEELRKEVLRKQLEPGTSLQQEEVAQRLGVSSTPVREAFAILEAEGLLEKRPHRGVVVARRDASELADIYEMRMILEPHAFRRALAHISESLIARLEETAADAERALHKPDVHACRRANSRFHEILVEASGSDVFTEVTKSLIARSLYAIPLDPNAIGKSVSKHIEIVRALKEGEATKATRLMRDHLKDMNEMLRSSAGVPVNRLGSASK